jgi:transcriptional regulator with XRE-family HTH domain
VIFYDQMRAGRALLGWSQLELAEAASVGVATVRRLEGSNNQIRGSAETVWKIQTALEKAGVEFIPADEMKGPGVRLKQVPEPPRRVRTRRSGTKS